MEQSLWMLQAIESNYEEVVLIIACTEEEANERWEDLFGDGCCLGKVVNKIDTVEGYQIIVK